MGLAHAKGAMALAAIAMLATPPAAGAPEQARRAQDFVDSVGVATHWGYGDTPYGGRYDEVKALLIASGIRHVRDGLHPRLQDLAASGIRATVVMEPATGKTMADLVAELRAFNAQGTAPAIEAVEGPNEPELFWPTYHADGYRGQGFPQGPIWFQQDLYATIKADSALSGLTVLGIALGTTLTPANPDNPLGNAGELAPFVDWGNFHPYPSGNAFNVPEAYDTIARYYWDSTHPSLPVEGFRDTVKPWLEYYVRPYQPKPMAATETGYATVAGGLSERVVAKYLPRLYLELFRKGLQRTFVYEFVDEWALPDNREANFGMLRHDLTPKPSYLAVKNLLAALADNDTPFSPQTLDFDLVVQPVTVSASSVRPGADDTPVVYDRTEYVRHLTLAKSDGRFALVLWHDIANADHSQNPPVELTPPDMPATLTLHQPFAEARLLRFEPDGSVTVTQAASPSVLSLFVPDRPLIVELIPPPPTDPDGAPTPGPDGSDAIELAADGPLPGDPFDRPRTIVGHACGCSAPPCPAALGVGVALALLRRRRGRAMTQRQAVRARLTAV